MDQSSRVLRELEYLYNMTFCTSVSVIFEAGTILHSRRDQRTMRNKLVQNTRLVVISNGYLKRLRPNKEEIRAEDIRKASSLANLSAVC